MARPAAYDHPPAKVSGWRLRPGAMLALLENLFFGAATVFAFLFAFVVLRQGVSSLANLAYLLVFWAVLAYLALPRLHRVLTAIYVPDYFIGRTRTSDGLLGDPVNLAFTGSREQIRSAMARSGWIEADPVDLGSSVRIVVASLTRRSYPTAPVSPLFLFGSMQELAFQQEVEGNPAQRHHVRFWPCPPDWLLPGGHRVDWLAAGSYDRAVGLSFFTLQVTHRIDRDIDVERDYIVDSLRNGCPEVTVQVIEDFSTGYHSRNGGGDAVATDGDLPVVDVSGVVPEAGVSPAAEVSFSPGTQESVSPSTERSVSPAAQRSFSPAAQKSVSPEDGVSRPAGSAGSAGVDAMESTASDPDDALHRVGRRPLSVVAAGVLALLSLALSLGSALIELREILPELEAEAVAEGMQNGQTTVLLAIVATIVATYLVMAVLAWLTFLGSQWARLCMLALLTLSQLSSLAQWMGAARPPATTMLALTLDVLTIYALTSLSARQWTREHGLSARRRRRLAMRRGPSK